MFGGLYSCFGGVGVASLGFMYCVRFLIVGLLKGFTFSRVGV